MTHTYKTAIIRKRAGMNMRRRPVAGYVVRMVGCENKTFQTLKAAKAWVDEVSA